MKGVVKKMLSLQDLEVIVREIRDANEDVVIELPDQGGNHFYSSLSASELRLPGQFRCNDNTQTISLGHLRLKVIEF